MTVTFLKKGSCDSTVELLCSFSWVRIWKLSHHISIIMDPKRFMVWKQGRIMSMDSVHFSLPLFQEGSEHQHHQEFGVVQGVKKGSVSRVWIQFNFSFLCFKKGLCSLSVTLVFRDKSSYGNIGKGLCLLPWNKILNISLNFTRALKLSTKRTRKNEWDRCFEICRSKYKYNSYLYISYSANFHAGNVVCQWYLQQKDVNDSFGRLVFWSGK